MQIVLNQGNLHSEKNMTILRGYSGDRRSPAETLNDRCVKHLSSGRSSDDIGCERTTSFRKEL